MNLISISIRRPVFAWILMAALIIFGGIAFTRLGISQLPDIDFPVLSLSITYEGAAPEVIEADVIQPIEERLLGIEGVKEMRSTIRQGAGSILLNLDINRNVDIALQDVQAAISQLRLPIGIDPPILRKSNPEDSPIMFLSVSADKPIREVIIWTTNFLIDQLGFIPDVGEVNIAGFSARNLRVWPDPDKLRKNDFTVTDILDALATQHLETAVGQYTEGARELRVRWLGEATSPEELGNMRIIRRGGQIVNDPGIYRLKDLARVEDGLTDIRRIARVDGKEAISVGIRKQRGSNEVELAAAVRKKVDELQSQLPPGYNLRVNLDFTRPTKAVVETTDHKLIAAAMVTIVVCFLFLGSWQAALNILFSIPTSIVGAFVFIYFFGFTLNLFTLLALTLAISIVVDDAIMLLENIVRHYRMGKTPAQAAYDGAMEILPAATAATFAVIAVFLPVVFMEGIIGKFFFQFGIAMSCAVLLSLLEAVTITPMRSAALLASAPKISKFEHYLDHKFEKLGEAYAWLLEKILRFPKTVVLLSLVGFGVSMLAIKTVRQEFVPLQDQDVIMISGQTPPGSSLEFTEKKTKEIEAIVRAHPDVKSFFSSIGAGGGGAQEVNQFSLPVTLNPREGRAKTHVQIMDELRKSFKSVENVKVSLRDNSARGLTSGRQFPVSFNLFGPDLEILNTKAQEITKRLNDEGLTQDMDTDFKLGLPELLIFPNREAMAARGVSIQAVSNTLNATVAGIRQNQFTADGRRYDIRVKLLDSYVTSPKDIEKIYVRNNFGNSIPLSKLVTFKEKKTYQSITRVNRQRAIGVYGNLQGGVSQSKVLARAEQIAHEVLPTGYGFSLEGAAAGLAESFRSLSVALAMGILVAYMVLAVQFNSFIHPLSVLVALPFSVTGALLTLWLTNTSLNLFSYIGLIVLMGISKKNSILLVEFTNHVRGEGVQNVKEALVKACPVRLRPILMTSVATIAAAAPLIFGNTVGQETRTPMGLTIVGGTIVSTILTLFVVPSLYQVLSGLENKNKVELKIED